MTVAQIKTRVANLFHKTTAECIVAGEDMILSAMNSAKLLAEQTHDFEKSKRLCEITISSSTGAALSTAKLLGTNTDVKIKSILNCSIVGDDGSLRPIDFRRRDSVMAEIRKVNRVEPWDSLERYPAEDHFANIIGIREVMQWGDQVLLRPMLESGSVKLAMECYTNMPDYDTTGTYTDFFTDFGHNFLVWQSVVELNHYFKTFIFREEGNLMPPDKLAEKYLLKLVDWDIYLIAEGVDATAD